MNLSNEKLVSLIQGGIFPKEHLETLFLQNEAFTNTIITKYGSKAHFEDMKQESYIVLCECAAGFDGSKGYKFVTYYGQALKIKLHEYGVQAAAVHIPVNEYAQVKDKIKIVSLDAPLSTETETTIGDLIPDTAGSFEDKTIKEIDGGRLWRACRRRLNKKQFSIIWLHYVRQKSLKDIAGLFNVSQGCIYDWHKKILRRLSRYPEIQAYNTCVYRHITLNTFKVTHTSAVEWAVIRREQITRGAAGLMLSIEKLEKT